MAGDVGSGNRLAPAFERTLTQAAARLTPHLERANTQAYLHAMRSLARNLKAPLPKKITDPDVLAAIHDRAHTSATSIVATQAKRMAALVQKYGSRGAAQEAFTAWEKGQKARIASYESAMTVQAARDDCIAKNDLTGVEHCVPQEAVCTVCQDAVDQGEVPLGTLDPPPYHINCAHSLATLYTVPDDPSSLWTGDTL